MGGVKIRRGGGWRLAGLPTVEVGHDYCGRAVCRSEDEEDCSECCVVQCMLRAGKAHSSSWDEEVKAVGVRGEGSLVRTRDE